MHMCDAYAFLLYGNETDSILHGHVKHVVASLEPWKISVFEWLACNVDNVIGVSGERGAYVLVCCLLMVFTCNTSSVLLDFYL